MSRDIYTEYSGSLYVAPKQEFYFSSDNSFAGWGEGCESGRIMFKRFVIPRKWYSFKDWLFLNKAHKAIKQKEVQSE